MNVAERVGAVRRRIDDAAAASGRDPAGITLVAVSKGFDAAAAAEAVAAGIADLGENRAQELRAKAEKLEARVRWHFVGHLQSNKVRTVVGVCRLVHSVDSVALGEAIAARARRMGITQEVLVEVNVSGEASKHGVAPAELAAVLDRLGALEGVEVSGLMTIPPWPEQPEASRPHYRRLRELAGVHRLGRLSMGMSRDLEVAVSEGATLVRVGEAIFGPRPAP